MLPDHPRFLSFCSLILSLLFITVPGSAFTANSLAITVESDGDATAVFDYTLEGFIENAIPESVLKEELTKGLSTSDQPPEVIAFDKSGATLLLKDFAERSDVPTGVEYLTVSMDFSKAEIALQDSAVSSVITADFTPQTTTVTFPDGYNRIFTDSSTLPSIRHIVIDPSKKTETATPTLKAPSTLPITSPATVRVTTVAAPATAAPVTEETTVVPLTSTPSSGLPVTATVIAVIGLAGAGTYCYAIRND